MRFSFLEFEPRERKPRDPLDAFVRLAWIWVLVIVTIAVLWGLADLVGLIPELDTPR